MGDKEVPKLMVIYDPTDRLSGLPAEERKRWSVQEATLSLPEGLEGKDIYALARKLAELLLEQI
jgi:hypothetical protein